MAFSSTTVCHCNIGHPISRGRYAAAAGRAAGAATALAAKGWCRAAAGIMWAARGIILRRLLLLLLDAFLQHS